VAVRGAFEHGAGGEDRTAEIAEHEHPVAGVGVRDGSAHAVTVGAEPTGGISARGLDADLGTGHLPGQRGSARRYLPAVRHDYDPDHALLRSGGLQV
jgi:hypothetical protein